MIKLLNIFKQSIQEEKEKRDRCLRIADRKFDEPSAYKSGAVVRCRQGKIWKGLKEEKELNVQDLAYQQTPGLLDRGIQSELWLLADFLDVENEVVENFEYEIKRVPLSSIKPSQFGEDYKNASSESEAEEFQKILSGEKDTKDHRMADFYPILVNKRTNKIIDGNHRHYALSAINSPYAVVLYVDIPSSYLEEEIRNAIRESLRDWFKKENWVRINTQGNITGPCGTMKKGKADTRCLPKAKAQSLTKAERASTARKKVAGEKKGKQWVKNTKKAEYNKK